jgi:hypothetical protein
MTDGHAETKMDSGEENVGAVGTVLMVSQEGENYEVDTAVACMSELVKTIMDGKLFERF